MFISEHSVKNSYRISSGSPSAPWIFLDTLSVHAPGNFDQPKLDRYSAIPLCLRLNDRLILSLKNKTLRWTITNRFELPPGLLHLPVISRHSWSQFYTSPMQYSARRLWYRWIFDKISSKTNL
ncbi:uncharacterized protein RHIMIDRAFT_105294 [Rhizopus microsporus ATCC 52813]|uniref:Uncharacterized protein n=1 Tax=Rhizopus microsporus ATCC 52813 TaxID=1340429 RepID=A0A2G4T152_RHIZD|nr:uncharacterized protein RHIMIDRAFT_105294 [Rhizopus microsporus ATCC 52813]PHZ14739.1 hypothetical protein RHIMIDRAFT_105294 [Rhizopus microsporus ATCC 52813]